MLYSVVVSMVGLVLELGRRVCLWITLGGVMSAMKRALEERTYQILNYFFPEGVDHMSPEEKNRWIDVSQKAALKMFTPEGEGYEEAIEEKNK
jgi:hypothetical protein